MKFRTVILTLASIITSVSAYAADRYVGGDISLLPTMEKGNTKYLDKTGKQISDLVTYCYDQGMNAMRVRLFVDPDSFLAGLSSPEQWEKDACQSYDYILPLCKRIQEAGHKLLLDFHYSDTWADPTNQWTPAAWASLSDNDLYQKIYDYTKEVLTKLKNDGVVPEFIQTGNEISYGMCWGSYKTGSPRKAYTNSSNSNLTRFGNLLINATKACREVCPQSKIVLHTERVANTGYLTSFYDWAKSINLDYDIIGTSYYFYYHGNVSQLDAALSALEKKNYGKEIWIVETGCYLNWAMGDSDKHYYGTTEADQNQFVVDLINTVDKHPSVTGLFWWEMEYNANGNSLAGNWYNASLFNNTNGRATPAFYTFSAWAGGDPNPDAGNNGDDSDSDFDTTCDYYFLYNNNGGENWAVPGTKMTNNNDGTYTISSVNISKNGDQYGWFSITSVNGSDWNAINSNRFGPSTADEDPTTMVNSKVVKEANSWQVLNGVYDVVFDAKNKTLTVKKAGTQDLNLSVSTELEGHSGTVKDNEISISVPKTDGSKYAYVNIAAPQGANAVYYQIVKTSAVRILALDGYVKAELKDGNYVIPLEVGTTGTLNLYYTTDSFQSVPVAYSYSVEEKVADDPEIKDPEESEDPGKDEPGKDEPGTDNPGNEDPGTDTPDPEKPGTDNPGDDPSGDNSGNDKPGTETPDPEKPGTDNPGNDKPDTPDVDIPGADNPGADKPGTDNPGNDGPGSDNPGTVLPDDDNTGGGEELDPGIQGPDDDDNGDDNNQGDVNVGDDLDPGFNGPDKDDENDPSNPDAGINGVIDDNHGKDYWFDLRGNRINRPTAPGLYIHNGKKIMIR